MELDLREWLSKSGRKYPPLKMTQPVQVTCWTKQSSTEGGNYLYDDTSGLMPIHKVHLPVDLNEGYPHDFIKKPEDESTPVDPIVRAARAADVDWKKVKICTFRNNLNKIALTPLNPDQPWMVHACHINGTTFLNIHKTPDSFPSHDNADRMTYYGYKFESICTRSKGPVDSTSEFGSVLSFNLGGLDVLMAAEIDCHDATYSSDDLTECFVELKTYRKPDHPRQAANMKRYKYPRWWVQSYLAGVRQLVLGGRDDAGMLLEVQKKSVSKLPSEARGVGATWNPWALLGCLHHTLTWILDYTSQHEGIHCTFSYEPPKQKVVCRVEEESSWARHLQQLLREAPSRRHSDSDGEDEEI